jgi:hypothetical protein
VAETVCGSAAYSPTGNLTRNFGELILLPTYSKCTTSLSGLKATSTIVSNECVYNFHQGNPAKEGTSTEGAIKIECPKGNEIKIDTGIFECRLTISEQGPLSAVTYKNVTGANKTVTTRGEIPKISIGSLSPSCELAGLKKTTPIEYKGEGKASGFNGATPINIEVF